MNARANPLDFIVIGAPRSGTTSLWMYLRSHPALHLPPDKEAAFFGSTRYGLGVERYLDQFFRFADPERKWGTVSPRYMSGNGEVPVPVIVERMHETAPNVKLVALLRDPVTRAFSEHRELVRLGFEDRSFEEAVDELLEPAALERDRSRTARDRGYVVNGEYARILSTYLERFARESLLVVFSADLERDPAHVVSTVCKHIGVDPDHLPANLGRRYGEGGTRLRVPAVAAKEIETYLEERVWIHLEPRARPEARRTFRNWLRFWNVSPPKNPPSVPAELRERLEEHYAEDARLLRRTTGCEPAWLFRETAETAGSGLAS